MHLALTRMVSQGSVVHIYVYFEGPTSTGRLGYIVVDNTPCHGKLSSAPHNTPLTLWQILFGTMKPHHLKRGSCMAIFAQVQS